MTFAVRYCKFLQTHMHFRICNFTPGSTKVKRKGHSTSVSASRSFFEAAASFSREIFKTEPTIPIKEHEGLYCVNSRYLSRHWWGSYQKKIELYGVKLNLICLLTQSSVNCTYSIPDRPLPSLFVKSSNGSDGPACSSFHSWWPRV